MGKKFKIKPVLTEIDSIVKADYNPRVVVEERLQQMILSLKYLGFLSPIYISTEGTILSGHQRTTAARALGYTKVPVVTLKVPDGLEEFINLQFNTCTCDMDSDVQGSSLYEEYKKHKINYKKMSVIPPDTYYPCMNTKQVKLTTLAKQLPMVSDYMKISGIGLLKANGFIPVVLEEGTNKIVNGIARLRSAFHLGWEEIPVVMVPKNQSHYAGVALNFLSMDFDLEKPFKEELRHHAYRRRGTSAVIKGLSRTYTYFVFGRALTTGSGVHARDKKKNTDMDLLPTSSPLMYKQYKKVYGKTIIDFGAGSLHDSDIMEMAGFEMYPFDPFATDDDWNVSIDITRQLALRMFEGLVKNKVKGIGTIISSYNLNSIPFHKDRMAYIIIAAAMCKITGTLFLSTQDISNRSRGAASSSMGINIEPNMTISNGNEFKTQKFFYIEELEKMLTPFFSSVKMKRGGTTLYAICSKPKRISPNLLKEALALEFNLPHKDGVTIDLVQESWDAFSEYTGMDLS